jgi:hypothetical protein
LAADLNVTVRTVQSLLTTLEPFGLVIERGVGRNKRSVFRIGSIASTAPCDSGTTTLAAFPTKDDLTAFTAILIEEVLDEKPSRLALAMACRRLPRNSNFRPSIAKVLKKLGHAHLYGDRSAKIVELPKYVAALKQRLADGERQLIVGSITDNKEGSDEKIVRARERIASPVQGPNLWEHDHRGKYRRAPDRAAVNTQAAAPLRTKRTPIRRQWLPIGCFWNACRRQACEQRLRAEDTGRLGRRAHAALSQARWLLPALPSPREPASPGRPDHDYDHDIRRRRDARIL